MFTDKIVKMSIHTKLICRFNGILIKIPVGFIFKGTWQLTLNSMWFRKYLKIATTLLKKKSIAGFIHTLEYTAQRWEHRNCGCTQR